jgi:hypothetical protein
VAAEAAPAGAEAAGWTPAAMIRRPRRKR